MSRHENSNKIVVLWYLFLSVVIPLVISLILFADLRNISNPDVYSSESMMPLNQQYAGLKLLFGGVLGLLSGMVGAWSMVRNDRNISILAQYIVGIGEFAIFLFFFGGLPSDTRTSAPAVFNVAWRPFSIALTCMLPIGFAFQALRQVSKIKYQNRIG